MKKLFWGQVSPTAYTSMVLSVDCHAWRTSFYNVMFMLLEAIVLSDKGQRIVALLYLNKL